MSHRTDIISDLQEQIAELMTLIEQMNRDHQSAQNLVSDPCSSHTLSANAFRLSMCQVIGQAGHHRTEAWYPVARLGIVYSEQYLSSSILIHLCKISKTLHSWGSRCLWVCACVCVYLLQQMCGSQSTACGNHFSLPCRAPGRNLGTLGHLSCHVGCNVGYHASLSLVRLCVAEAELELLIFQLPFPSAGVAGGLTF